MLKKVKSTISKYNLLSESDSVLVGLSGGADSVALLVCLKELGYKVSAMHINHNLRGDESDRDEQFCRDLCVNLGISLTVRSVDVKAYCLENKLGLEEGARELRYMAFSESRADKICTAHTLSDSLETMLINLSRGTALKGLCGVPYKRGNIARPLIECTREEVEEFLSNRNISYVIDSTNNSNDYTRNKIRHLVIPNLAQISNEQNGSLYKNISKTLNAINQDEDYLNSMAENLLNNAQTDENAYDLEVINSAHSAISNRTLIMILKRCGAEVSQAKLDDLKNVCNDGKKINLKKNVYASVKSGKLIITGETKKPVLYLKELSLENLDSEGITQDFLGKEVKIRLINCDNKTDNIHSMFTKKDIDYDKIIGKIFLRNRISGDRIRLTTRGLTKTLKKLFNESVPFEERERTVVLSDDNGVIYVEGFGVDDRVSADENTKRILSVEIS